MENTVLLLASIDRKEMLETKNTERNGKQVLIISVQLVMHQTNGISFKEILINMRRMLQVNNFCPDFNLIHILIKIYRLSVII